MASIVVGMSGGIAAYKAVGVVRALVLEGHDVHVVPTDSALRFVGKPTLEAISRNPVTSDLFDDVASVRHVALGQQADLIVVAPATANTLAKMAGGQADDLLGTTLLASAAPVVVAPAMHTEMWEHPATVNNVRVLRERGVRFVGPGTGQLTGQDSGTGRMAEPDEIVASVRTLLAASQDLAGSTILITAGGTREPLDPVRYLGNRSSGRQGVELAIAARDRGAHVLLVAGHMEIPPPTGVEVIPVSTASEMMDAVSREMRRATAVVMAAAVADYRPEVVAEGKIKKESAGDTLELRLVKNPDILATISAGQRDQVVIGFAAETAATPEELLELGRAKIARKGCDFLVINRVGWTEGFAQPTNAVRIIDKTGNIVVEANGTKASVATSILDLLVPSPSGAR